MAIGGLGSGLDFLFDENTAEVPGKRTLRLSEIEPNRAQPRKHFSEEAIAALADSIRQHGMLQPILVRPYGMVYQIVAGERRWRAATMLGLEEVPVIIKEFSDQETMQIALIENLVRENLTPLEEAAGFRDLMEQYGMTQEAVAKSVGKSRSAVANALRLLQLPEEIRQMLEDGKMTAGHARALLAITDPALQLETARKCVEYGLTVRAVEKIAADAAEQTAQKTKRKRTKSSDQYYKEMELQLADQLQRKVSVTYGKKKGTLVLEFYDKEDLAALAKQLTELE
jgi:ParB family chromosome partitioning protein